MKLFQLLGSRALLEKTSRSDVLYALEAQSEGATCVPASCFDFLKRTDQPHRGCPGCFARRHSSPFDEGFRKLLQTRVLYTRPRIDRLAPNIGEIRTSLWHPNLVTFVMAWIKRRYFSSRHLIAGFLRPDLNGTQRAFTVTAKSKTLKRGLTPSKSGMRKLQQGTGMSDLYRIMKGKAYRLAETIIAPKHKGEDLLRTIMSDSDESHQPLFLAMLPQVIPAKAHRQILLDGLAREYAGADNWMAYVESEMSK